MGHPKSLAAGINEFALERVLRRKGHRVEKQMQFAELFGRRLKDGRNVLVPSNIAGQNQSFESKSAREFFNIFFQTFALISEGEPRSGLVPGLRDRPGDRA